MFGGRCFCPIFSEDSSCPGPVNSQLVPHTCNSPSQDSPKSEEWGPWKEEGRALQPLWQRRAFLSLLEYGRDPGWGALETRLLIKPCFVCGFNLNIQGHTSWNFCKPSPEFSANQQRLEGAGEAKEGRGLGSQWEGSVCVSRRQEIVWRSSGSRL